MGLGYEQEFCEKVAGAYVGLSFGHIRPQRYEFDFIKHEIMNSTTDLFDALYTSNEAVLKKFYDNHSNAKFDEKGLLEKIVARVRALYMRCDLGCSQSA